MTPEYDCRARRSVRPAVMTAADDRRFMAMALALAERGLGNVWPNPAVGCVLVKDGRVVGRGWTQPGGRPHAESEAIARAGAAARGSTAYVTLEPCAHHGRTPPCVDAMLAAGIARAVVAAVDPDPRVDGKGIARLRAAGMTVDVGCLEEAARRQNAGFFAAHVPAPPVGGAQARHQRGRPDRHRHRREPVDHRRRLPEPRAIACACATTRSWSAAAPRWPTIPCSPAACPGWRSARRSASWSTGGCGSAPGAGSRAAPPTCRSGCSRRPPTGTAAAALRSAGVTLLPVDGAAAGRRAA